MHQLPYPADPTLIAVAAKRIGVHVTTLRRWIKAGEIPAWRIGPQGWQRKRRYVVSLAGLLARAVEPAITDDRRAKRLQRG